MPSELQALGPNQERWLTALESGEHQQGATYLCNNGKKCCLGVGCIIFGISSLPKRFTSGLRLIFEGDCWAVAPPSLIDLLKLYDECGIRADGSLALTSLNDMGKTFAEIAAIVRSDPAQYFKGPA